MRYFLSTLALFVVITAVAVFLFVENNHPEGTATVGSVVAWQDLSGTVTPANEYPLQVFVPATVGNISIKVGDSINQGDKLMTLTLNNNRTVNVLAQRSGLISFVAAVGRVSAGNQLVSITDKTSSLGEATVNQSGSISVGDQAKIEYQGREIVAQVTDITSSSGQNTIHLSFQSPLPTFASFQAKVVTAFKNNVLMVPKGAVIKDNNNYYVRKVSSFLNPKVQVTIGLEGNDYTEITAGLAEGDKILLSS